MCALSIFHLLLDHHLSPRALTDQGKSVEVAIVDECMGCNLVTSLDLTTTAFSQLANLGANHLSGITWEWVQSLPVSLATYSLLSEHR
jgi:hypothetical protein